MGMLSQMNPQTLSSPEYLYYAWVSLGVCMIVAVFGMQTSMKTYREYANFNMYRLLDTLGFAVPEGNFENSYKKVSQLDRYLNICNATSLFAFGLGLTLLCLFMGANLLPSTA